VELYESDAHYENFLLRALAYAAGMPEAETRQFTAREREDRLLRLLDEQPFLVVLDGLERILLAYARLDAAHLADDDLDERTANELVDAMGLPQEARETYLEKHRLRRSGCGSRCHVKWTNLIVGPLAGLRG